LSSGNSISSAIVIAIAVVMPWPTSARGRSNAAVPSGFTVTLSSPIVGNAASVRMSVRSTASIGCSVGIDAFAAVGARPNRAAATSVGAAIR
jgi:hypothetical protein